MSAGSRRPQDPCYLASSYGFLNPFLWVERDVFFNNSWEAGSEVSILWGGSSLRNRYTLTVKSADAGYGHGVDISLLSMIAWLVSSIVLIIVLTRFKKE